MKFSRQSISQYILYDTRVDNLFLSEYMVKAPESCVKAYLLGLMYADLGQPAEDELLARRLGITEKELQECWRYWEDEGLITRKGGSGGNELCFLNMREQAFGSSPEKSHPEDEFSLSDKDSQKLYEDIQKITNKLLSDTEIKTVSEWLYNYHLSKELILEAYKQAAEKGKPNFRVAGRILEEWRKHDVNNTETLSEYLATVDKKYVYHKKIFNELSFFYTPTMEQKRIMDSWVEELGFSMEEILEACKSTAGTAKPNIKYIDTVLRNKRKTSEKEEKIDYISKVYRLYEKRREENKKKTAEIRNEIYNKLPRIKEIENEQKDASYQLSKSLFSGGNGKNSVLNQRKRLETLKEEKAKLLIQAGYKETALDNIYTCPLCKDTGELDTGKACSCFSENLKMLQNGLVKID